MRSGSNREVEIKLALKDPAGGRRLERAGFHVKKSRAFEQNTLFDDGEHALRKSGTLLRLRTYGKRYILTLKGQAEPGRHKTREELETDISDRGALRRF